MGDNEDDVGPRLSPFFLFICKIRAEDELRLERERGSPKEKIIRIKVEIKIKITKVNGSRDVSDTKPHKIAVSGFGWAYLLNKTQGNRK